MTDRFAYRFGSSRMTEATESALLLQQRAEAAHQRMIDASERGNIDMARAAMLEVQRITKQLNASALQAGAELAVSQSPQLTNPARITGLLARKNLLVGAQEDEQKAAEEAVTSFDTQYAELEDQINRLDEYAGQLNTLRDELLLNARRVARFDRAARASLEKQLVTLRAALQKAGIDEGELLTDNAVIPQIVPNKNDESETEQPSGPKGKGKEKKAQPSESSPSTSESSATSERKKGWVTKIKNAISYFTSSSPDASSAEKASDLPADDVDGWTVKLEEAAIADNEQDLELEQENFAILKSEQEQTMREEKVKEGLVNFFKTKNESLPDVVVENYFVPSTKKVGESLLSRIRTMESLLFLYAEFLRNYTIFEWSERDNRGNMISHQTNDIDSLVEWILTIHTAIRSKIDAFTKKKHDFAAWNDAIRDQIYDCCWILVGLLFSSKSPTELHTLLVDTNITSLAITGLPLLRQQALKSALDELTDDDKTNFSDFFTSTTKAFRGFASPDMIEVGDRHMHALSPLIAMWTPGLNGDVPGALFRFANRNKSRTEFDKQSGFLFAELLIRFFGVPETVTLRSETGDVIAANTPRFPGDESGAKNYFLEVSRLASIIKEMNDFDVATNVKNARSQTAATARRALALEKIDLHVDRVLKLRSMDSAVLPFILNDEDEYSVLAKNFAVLNQELNVFVTDVKYGNSQSVGVHIGASFLRTATDSFYAFNAWLKANLSKLWSDKFRQLLGADNSLLRALGPRKEETQEDDLQVEDSDPNIDPLEVLVVENKPSVPPPALQDKSGFGPTSVVTNRGSLQPAKSSSPTESVSSGAKRRTDQGNKDMKDAAKKTTSQISVATPLATPIDENDWPGWE